MMKTTVALRHLAFEELGSFDSVLRRTGYLIRYLDVGLDPIGSSEDGSPDLLIVLGGPIGACDESLYPFLTTEIDLIEQRLAAGKATLTDRRH
jgi:GMP synthase (glutamine-hydrolysing)